MTCVLAGLRRGACGGELAEGSLRRGADAGPQRVYTVRDFQAYVQRRCWLAALLLLHCNPLTPRRYLVQLATSSGLSRGGKSSSPVDGASKGMVHQAGTRTDTARCLRDACAVAMYNRASQCHGQEFIVRNKFIIAQRRWCLDLRCTCSTHLGTACKATTMINSTLT